METAKQIVKQKQYIASQEKLLAMEKLKKRRADTRRKIEFGGLVIKAGMDRFNKAVILGVLDYAIYLMQQDPSYENLFQSRGNNLFLAD